MESSNQIYQEGIVDKEE